MQQQTILCLNGKNYSREELYDHCHDNALIDLSPGWYKEILNFIVQWLNHDDHVIVQTSGSTGKPKSIQLKKKWMEYSAIQTCRYFRLDEQSNLLLCLPARYIAGKMMIVRAISSGCNLITIEPRVNPFENISEKIDLAAITPHQLYESLETLTANAHIKTIIVGGGEIPPALEDQIQILPQNIYATYGMTETSTHVALRKVNGGNRSQFYTIIGDTEISLDERGCLLLKNPNLFDGRLVTNDIVELIDDRSFRWLGRWDNVINSGGIKLVAEDLEKKIAHLRKDKMLFTGIPDEKLGNACILVVKSQQLSEKEKSGLRDELSRLIPRYALPRIIVSLPKLPLLESGKVDRISLRKKIMSLLKDPGTKIP
jgi:o-succinylbenzoate---CoA ligase